MIEQSVDRAGRPRQAAPAEPPTPTACDSMKTDETIESLVTSLRAQFEAVMGRAEQVEADCDRLRLLLPTPPDIDLLQGLLPLLRRRAGESAAALFALIEESVPACPDPWVLLDGMLAARDRGLAKRALALALRLAESGSLPVDWRAWAILAERTQDEDSPLAERDTLSEVARLLRSGRIGIMEDSAGGTAAGAPLGQAATSSCAARAPLGQAPTPARPAGDRQESSAGDPVLRTYLQGTETRIRRLAARILDLGGEPAPRAVADQLLGAEDAAFLAPYLDYTRATHLDLLQIAPAAGVPAAALPSLRKAEDVCGAAVLREVLSALGWVRVNLGIHVETCVGVSVAGSLPLMVTPSEAALLESYEDARRTSESFLIRAHGGPPPGPSSARRQDDPVARFRSYNLAHAEALAEILDVAPLTREKVLRIVARMDRIVRDFVALFEVYSDECAILPGVYAELKEKVLGELGKEGDGPQLSAELTRLVQMFEEPASIGGVRTLHGLKRYLHQRGLRLGFRLVEAGRATNRTVDLVLASRKRVLRTLQGIRYADFEPEDEPGAASPRVPYPVAVVADGFGRQMLHGQEKFPDVRIFCYGNEVHYYLAFGSHPAFLRIDYAPPLQGGMIDLEYYGVSKNELSLHPNLSLDFIRLFFRRLEFDISIENTHVHARYDKERALDLGDLCEKAEALLRLAPYLMEVDWTVGYLALADEARLAVAAAWAESFANWGVLPISHLLTRDRQSILAAVESGPAGEKEVPWSGHEPYRDRFSAPPPAGFLARLRAAALALGPDAEPFADLDGSRPIGQIALERAMLRPLREAVARGELAEGPGGFHRPPPGLFERRHEAEEFARILASDDESVAAACGLARLVTPLDRTLRFQTTGAVGGHDVQRARLALRGKAIGLFVLRDPRGIAALAIFAGEEFLFRRRAGAAAADDGWIPNWSSDAAALAAELRQSNYATPGTTSPGGGTIGDAASARALFRRTNPAQRPGPLPGERIVDGLRASPGRSVGRAIFGTAARAPSEFKGCILVAPFVRPEDNTWLYHCAGVVSTGGGVLSHAGLIAMQFHKPSLIVPGTWIEEAAGAPALTYTTTEYSEQEREIEGYKVSERKEIIETEHRLREGDLLVLDAEEGTLRVLGQDRETIALHEGLRQLDEAARGLAAASREGSVLVLRGKKLQARHQIEKLLGRLDSPALALHAVREILTGEQGGPSDRAQLLSHLLANGRVSAAARGHVVRIGADLERRYRSLIAKAAAVIPESGSAYEILSLRIEVLRLRETLVGARAALRECGLGEPPAGLLEPPAIDAAARNRLELLRTRATRSVLDAAQVDPNEPRLRHLLRRIDKLDLALGPPAEIPAPLASLRARLAARDERAHRECADRRILGPADGGFELFPFIGGKAANLAEIERLGGAGLVPAWFVVTDRAFMEVLGASLALVAPGLHEVPEGAATLGEAIEAILARADLDPARKSSRIRALWEGLTLPEDLRREVATAYRCLGEEAPTAVGGGGDQRSGGGAARDGSGDSEGRSGAGARVKPESAAGGVVMDTGPQESDGQGRIEPFVAIRSSALEEDAESAARAGEFETFLFIRGEEPLLEHLARAWGGLWTERAIHNRETLPLDPGRTGGGVIVQRIAWSRISGVLQTVNVAGGDLREMIINAGLGLGEGVVSGTVAADQVVVAKEGDLERGPLRFRYITADKREQVVFNRRAGFGTGRSETAYHQRLRPALEYVELCELVRAAVRLEEAYGYPLDIEFGIEGMRLYVLQARPVPAAMAALVETVERYPLRGGGRTASAGAARETRP